MKDGGKYQNNVPHLRNGFDSFTPKHKLEGAKEEYVQAVYRFREAEQANSPDAIALKREMEFVGRKLEAFRRVGTTRGNRLRSTSSGLHRQTVARSLLGYELRLNKGGAGQQQMQQQQ